MRGGEGKGRSRAVRVRRERVWGGGRGGRSERQSIDGACAPIGYLCSFSVMTLGSIVEGNGVRDVRERDGEEDKRRPSRRGDLLVHKM